MPFLELNAIWSVSEAVGAAVETCCYGVLAGICGAVVILHVSQVEGIFVCMGVESVGVLQGCLVFFWEET